MSNCFLPFINSKRLANMKNKNVNFSPKKLQTSPGSPQIEIRNKANYFYFEFFLICGNSRCFYSISVQTLNPIQTRGEGGGLLRPASTLKLCNLVTVHALPLNFVTFPKLYLGTFWHERLVSSKLAIAMATTL